MTRPSIFRRFLRDRSANTALLFSLSLPVVVGAAGLGVETGYWYFKQRELQTAADVAAVAGTVEKRAGHESGVIQAAALTEAVEHGFEEAVGTIDVNDPPTSGPNQDARSVEVILRMPTTRFFSKLFASEEVILGARGVARYEDGGQACILALDPEESGAVTFTGNAVSLINGCNVMSNSLHDNALVVNGSADITVPCALAAGGVSVDEGLTLTDCPEPQNNVPPAADPFKNLPEPDLTGPCMTMPSGNGAATLSPGRYCGGGNLKGNKTFSPGVYIIDGGDLNINANAEISGEGVTFYFTNDASADFNGAATIQLSAPTTGTYKGVLMYGDRDNEDATNKFNGTADSELTGALYFPSQPVEFLGNFSGENGCMRIVARTIDFTGSADFNANCAGAGLNDMPLPGRVSLVE